jgi:DNA-directed RNA polymerase subunit L
MEITILKDEKTNLDLELDSVTVAEVLRVYLNKEGAKLAVWKQEHPTKNPVLHIEADNPKKILKDAIKNLQKEIDGAVADFKKMK